MADDASDIEIFEGRHDLVQAAAEALVAAVEAAIRERGRCLLALTGGETPRDLYRHLATGPFISRLDWSRVHFFWGDERCVPPDHADSNFRMARETLLDKLPVTEDNVHRMRGEDDPRAAATAYERLLRAQLDTPAGPPAPDAGRRFDLTLMGLGDDGHTASLFPGHRAVRETQRWVTAEFIDELEMWRITLTPPLINASAEILYLVAGAQKAGALQRVLQGPRDAEALPAQAIHASAGRMRWLVDAAAARQLR